MITVPDYISGVKYPKFYEYRIFDGNTYSVTVSSANTWYNNVDAKYWTVNKDIIIWAARLAFDMDTAGSSGTQYSARLRGYIDGGKFIVLAEQTVIAAASGDWQPNKIMGIADVGGVGFAPLIVRNGETLSLIVDIKSDDLGYNFDIKNIEIILIYSEVG